MSSSKQVHVVKSTDVQTSSGGQTDGMTRKPAITGLASICSSIMLAEPHSASAVHHHGAQDTIVYAVRGQGAVVSEGGKKRQVLKQGDFALIPAYQEHQEVNDGNEEVEWVIVRSGAEPDVVNLEGWGKS
ncbi:RmlC-like cupin [Aureobasidium pullulans]|uniref:RmlC-like cupin n=1 Tax=Aureobasidium pullulans TaxID=5580 RepID=A0A4S8S8G9_AURPU|nr:RmlC-like cupin [Aureobasidium pullulans]THW53049.1 RmlC-like cupin [Aureobasidium pullulans]THW61728.1 RmlC-like cupin [Aureobasidium pullulans]THW67286.1 RmlC-like cupin [Aureobasidium pullulans]THY62783.1 RmlC-like cupin [Aureobasidium pullulans]